MTWAEDDDSSILDTPLQAELRQALAFETAARPNDMGLRSQMRALLLDELGDAAEQIRHRERDRPVVADRIHVADVLACERYYVEERGVPFSYTINRARAQVSGAILRRWFFRDPRAGHVEWHPIEAAHEVLGELAEEEGELGSFISGLSTGGRAELAAAVVDVVHAFEESWPVNATPRVVRAHSPLRTTLLDGRLVLTYRVGFKFGQPKRVDGAVMSTVVLFDVRPGRSYEEEERFNRWYAALLELLQVGVAPSRVVTWYAESQTVCGEEIDEEKLEAATRRVAGAVRRMAALEAGLVPPEVNPGWRCGFCAVANSCEPGTRWLEERTG